MCNLGIQKERPAKRREIESMKSKKLLSIKSEKNTINYHGRSGPYPTVEKPEGRLQTTCTSVEVKGASYAVSYVRYFVKLKYKN